MHSLQTLRYSEAELQKTVAEAREAHLLVKAEAEAKFNRYIRLSTALDHLRETIDEMQRTVVSPPLNYDEAMAWLDSALKEGRAKLEYATSDDLKAALAALAAKSAETGELIAQARAGSDVSALMKKLKKTGDRPNG